MSNHTFAEIVKSARLCKKSVENKQTLKVNPKWGYYYAQAILNPRKNITRISFEQYPKSHGDNISNQIKKADYIDCAKRIVAFTKKNHLMPNFVKWNNKKISAKDYTYNFAKIIVWYADHQNTLPAYNTINTDIWKKNTIKKYGHATSSGCDNRGQNNGYYCGCHSLQEIFRNLTGIVVPQRTIAEWAGTTEDGTDHWGLETAVAQFNRKYGKNLKLKWYNYSELGRSGLKKIISSKNQDFLLHLLYRLKWGHYEVLNQWYSDYVDVQNSLGDYCDYGCYCGYVEERYWSTLESYIGGISQKSVMVVTNAG